MKRIVTLLTLAIGLHATAHAQTTKKRVPLPPPPPRIMSPPPSIKPPPKPSRTIYEKLLDDGNSSPLAFLHIIDADTVILPNQTFRKQLEVGPNGVRLETGSVKDTTKFAKGDTERLGSYYVKYSFFDLKVAKDIAVLTSSKTGQVLKYQLFLNPQKTKIIRIQDLSSKEIYTPAKYQGVTPMMPMGF